MQPSYFVHEHCLQRYRFPRSALFSEAEGGHCQNSKIHFIRSQPLDAVVFNHLSQQEWEYIYICVCVILICMVVMSKASFSELSNMFISHVINTLHSTARSGCDYFCQHFHVLDLVDTSSAPYVVYEPRNGLAMLQWIECETKTIAEIKKLELS